MAALCGNSRQCKSWIFFWSFSWLSRSKSTAPCTRGSGRHNESVRLSNLLFQGHPEALRLKLSKLLLLSSRSQPVESCGYAAGKNCRVGINGWKLLIEHDKHQISPDFPALRNSSFQTTTNNVLGRAPS